MLEVIHQPALENQPARPHPLLFVHGGWHGAWCWQEHFMPYFAAQGYNTYAMSLRGHGNSPGKVSAASLHDFVQDLAETVSQLATTTGAQPILIGHSLGGIVSLLYAGDKTGQEVPALVLLAPAWNIPGISLLTQSIAILSAAPLRNLAAFLQGEWYPPPASTLFGEKSAPYWQRLTNESTRALFQLIGLHFSRNVRLSSSIPTLLTGGGADRTINTRHVQALRELLKHGEYRNYPDATHDVMLNPDIREASAAEVARWLATTL